MGILYNPRVVLTTWGRGKLRYLTYTILSRLINPYKVRTVDATLD